MNLEMKVEPTKERKDFHSELYRLETAAAAIKFCPSLKCETKTDEARLKDGLAQSLLDATTMLRLGLSSHGQKLLRLTLKFQGLKVPQQPEVDDEVQEVEDDDEDMER